MACHAEVATGPVNFPPGKFHSVGFKALLPPIDAMWFCSLIMQLNPENTVNNGFIYPPIPLGKSGTQSKRSIVPGPWHFVAILKTII